MNEMFSAHLRELRANRDKSQKEMAQEIGISAAALSSYEKGQKTPPLEIAEKIARTYSVSLDWLCGIDDAIKPDGIRNYSEAIKMLLALDTAGLIWLYDDYINGELDTRISGRGKTMRTFLYKWNSIMGSCQKGVVDGELYQAWVEKQIRDNDKPIDFANTGEPL